MSKVTETHVMGDKRAPWSDEANHWRVTLRYQGRRLTVDFWTGPAAGEPDAASVVECLVSDALLGEQDFHGFCSDLGYDDDSRKAYAQWQDMGRQARRIHQLLGADFDAFASGECVA